MFYSNLVRKASNIMFEAHKDDKDKGGYPYVLHPFAVAFTMEDEISVCVALLHDVIEDHSDKYSFEYLEEEGFPEEVINALKLLTHDRDTGYMEYVRKIAENPVAARVKLADLKHNINEQRLDGIHAPKHELYLEAVRYLEEKQLEEIENA